MASYEFALPDVAEGLSEGEIMSWHIAVGDRVSADQIIVEVQTDKAIVEIPSPVGGIVTALGGQPGQMLAVGAMLATFDTDASSASPPAPVEQRTLKEPTPERSRAPVSGSRVKASPATRKLARTLGVDLTTVAATGSRGQITRDDVERVMDGPSQPAPAPVRPAPAQSAAPERAADRSDTEVPLQGLRRQIAVTMQTAWREIPHIFTFEEVDASALVAARRALADELEPRKIRLSFMPFFIKACVAALQANPSFNASLDMQRGRIIHRGRFNIGFATAAPDGLLVPVVHDADRKSIPEIAEEIDTLADLARERRVTVTQLSQGTFTISNYGSYGSHMGTPIIRPPEVAIAGFGRIRDAVVPVDGVPAVRPSLPLAVSADHRMNDGEQLWRFTSHVMRCLAEPVRLLGHA